MRFLFYVSWTAFKCLYAVCVCYVQFQNVYFIVSLLQPHSGTKQVILRTYIPISAEQMSIDPHVTLFEWFHIKESVAHTLQYELPAQHFWIFHFFINFLPLKRSSGVQEEAISLPFEGGIIISFKVEQPFFILPLHLVIVDVAHCLHNYPQLTALLFLALHFNGPVLIYFPCDFAQKLFIHEKHGIIVGHKGQSIVFVCG